jgi:hypothetical protein
VGRSRLLLSLGLAGAICGCDLPGGASAGPNGREALESARTKAQSARYLVVLDDVGVGREGRRPRQRLEFSPGLTVISQNGRVLLWESRDVSYTLRKRPRCYDRSTHFERADAVELKRDIVVPRGLLSRAELDESRGRPVIRWRGPVTERGYRVEGLVQLDEAGRAVLKRERVTWLGRGRRGNSYERRYRYPARLKLGPPPRPRC